MGCRGLRVLVVRCERESPYTSSVTSIPRPKLDSNPNLELPSQQLGHMSGVAVVVLMSRNASLECTTAYFSIEAKPSKQIQ